MDFSSHRLAVARDERLTLDTAVCDVQTLRFELAGRLASCVDLSGTHIDDDSRFRLPRTRKNLQLIASLQMQKRPFHSFSVVQRRWPKCAGS